MRPTQRCRTFWSPARQPYRFIFFFADLESAHFLHPFHYITLYRFCIDFRIGLVSVSIYVNVFTNNPFLSNTVKIHEKHKVVKTGLYGIVRHPMYLASCMACASGFTILGSWLCVPLYGVFIKLILTRISFEEKELLLALPEYANYVAEVQHKLIPIYINRKKSNYSWSNLHH